MVNPNNKRANILGVEVDSFRPEQLQATLTTIIQKNGKALIPHVNIHGLNLAYEQAWLGQFFQQSDFVFCDGAGVRLGAKLLGYDLPPRITYADWIWQLSRYGAEQGHTFFFLGARPGVANQAAANLLARYPKLQIVGIQHGYFDKTAGGPQNQAVLQAINAANPNILLVAFGMPLQERWLLENWAAIEANIGLTGGAVFDYAAGQVRRAPLWMTNNGLEWLGRLWIEPGRLWQRYLIGNPRFFWRILRQRFSLLPKSPLP